MPNSRIRALLLVVSTVAIQTSCGQVISTVTAPAHLLHPTARVATRVPTTTLIPAVSVSITPISRPSVTPHATATPYATTMSTATPVDTSTPEITQTITVTQTIRVQAERVTTSTAKATVIPVTAALIHPTATLDPITAAKPCKVGQIKGNRNSMIYHVPDGAWYAVTSKNVVCFDTEEEAQAAGYRRSKR